MAGKTRKVTSKKIATWIINHTNRESGEAMTHLKLQKLVYYCQAWYLANFDKPLFQEDFQAWAHGPVCRGLYNKYRDAGWSALRPEKNVKLPGEIEDFIASIFREYGQFSATKLEEMTHEEQPWKITRGSLAPEERCTEIIHKLLIRNYYAAKIGKKEISKISE